MAQTKVKRPSTVKAAIGFELFNGVMGIASGWALVYDPSGRAMGMNTDIIEIEGFPIGDFYLVGLFMLLVFGFIPLIISWGLITKEDWKLASALMRWSRRHWAWVGAVAVSVAEIVWMVVEVSLIGLFPFTVFWLGLQILMLCILSFESVKNFYPAPSKVGTPVNMAIAVVPLILLAMAILFLIPLWLTYSFLNLTPHGISSDFFLLSSTVGTMAFSLAYLGILFINPAQNRAWQGFWAIESSIVLFMFALWGSRYWYANLREPDWGVLFFLSPLIFFMPAVLVICLGKRKSRQTASSSSNEPLSPIGWIYLSAYIVSLLLYISVMSISGMSLLSWYSSDFTANLDINIVFWFLLPVQAGALLVYTVACGKGGASWWVVIARLVLCASFVLICCSALKHLPGRVYW